MVRSEAFAYRGVRPVNLNGRAASIAKHTFQVYQSLVDIDLARLGISDYNQRYLLEKLAKPEYEFALIKSIFTFLLQAGQEDPANATFVDYGAGSGLNCLVARALGIGTVVYCDIYDVSAQDAQILAECLDLRADHYVVGDIDDLSDYLDELELPCDMFASHDCIEHIYDIESFFDGLSRLPFRKMTLWLSSAANPMRSKTRRKLMESARAAESRGTAKTWGHKERDATEPFLRIRREIICEETPGLSSEVIDLLAQKTRGKRESDIRNIIGEYCDTGILPPDPEHPTNTCDPYTGNWVERLMDPCWLAQLCRDKGLCVEVAPGYWSPDPRNRLKDFAKTATNFAITRLGRFSLRFAPYYVIRGETIRSPQTDV